MTAAASHEAIAAAVRTLRRRPDGFTCTDVVSLSRRPRDECQAALARYVMHGLIDICGLDLYRSGRVSAMADHPTAINATPKDIA